MQNVGCKSDVLSSVENGVVIFAAPDLACLQQRATPERNSYVCLVGLEQFAIFACSRMLGATFTGRRWAVAIDYGILLSPKNKLYVCDKLTKIKCFFRSTVLLATVLLCSCGLAKLPLKPVLTADVKSIELAKLETDNILLIRRLNPLFAVMGSSGLLLDAVMVADHAHEYEKRAGQVHDMCTNLFVQTLVEALTDRGYKVGLSQKAYWDYYKKNQKKILDRTDTIFRIKLKQMGFWSKGLSSPFLPSIFVQAELIEPVSRNVLYSDRFAMGLDAGALQMMSLSHGEVSLLPGADPDAVYQNFSDLLDDAEQSREALLKIVKMAARHIAKGFRGLKSGSQPVLNPVPYRGLPEIPLSSAVKL